MDAGKPSFKHALVACKDDFRKKKNLHSIDACLVEDRGRELRCA